MCTTMDARTRMDVHECEGWMECKKQTCLVSWEEWLVQCACRVQDPTPRSMTGPLGARGERTRALRTRRLQSTDRNFESLEENFALPFNRWILGYRRCVIAHRKGLRTDGLCQPVLHATHEEDAHFQTKGKRQTSIPKPEGN